MNLETLFFLAKNFQDWNSGKLLDKLPLKNGTLMIGEHVKINDTLTSMISDSNLSINFDISSLLADADTYCVVYLKNHNGFKVQSSLVSLNFGDTYVEAHLINIDKLNTVQIRLSLEDDKTKIELLNIDFDPDIIM